jgi:hypothetical protein
MLFISAASLVLVANVRKCYVLRCDPDCRQWIKAKAFLREAAAAAQASSLGI